MFTKVVTDEVIAQYTPMVKRIAYEYYFKYRMVDRDDIEQEIWMWFLTHPAKVREWSELDDKHREKMVARSIRNAAMTFCVKEKARIEGYHVDDLFWYSKDFIKELLPSVMSEDWKRVQAGSGPSNKPVSESGDWLAYAVDIRRAYDALTPEDQEMVRIFYIEDGDGHALQEATGRPTVRAAEMAANRAVGKMVKFLGGERPNLNPVSRFVSLEEKKEEENE